jgi:hypothetical protein
MNERWLPVTGWEGLYEVSDQGRVRSLDRHVEMQDTRWGGVRERIFFGKIRALTWTTPNHGGAPYLTVTFKTPERNENHRVHRLVLEAFISACPRGHEGAHDDGDTANNKLSNLSWKTPVENAQDKLRHGTQIRGLAAARYTVMTPAKIRALRAAVAAGASQKSQREKYRLSAGYVCQLVNKTGKYTKGCTAL